MMKQIELFYLESDPNTVLRNLDFDACLDDYDPEVNPSAEMFNNIHFVTNENRVMPFSSPIVMHGPLRYIQGKDILTSEPSFWRVISSSFKAVLDEMGSTEQKFIPVRIYDGEFRYDDDLGKRPQRFTDDYFLLYLPTTLKIFNYQDSEYSFDYVSPNGSLEFARNKAVAPYAIPQLQAENAPVNPKLMVLNISEDELPLYFRLPVRSSDIFVTRKGVNLMRRRGIRNLYTVPTSFPVYTMQ